MSDKDEDSICKKCGTTADNHFTAWEGGVPVVGSYRDAPNGRICSPNAAEVVHQAAGKLWGAIAAEDPSEPLRTAWYAFSKILRGDEPEKKSSCAVRVELKACEFEYLETSHRTFCLTHQRDEVACVKEKLEGAVDALNKIHDLAGQMSGPNPHPHLGAIQDWCHQVTGPCEGKKAGGALK